MANSDENGELLHFGRGKVVPMALKLKASELWRQGLSVRDIGKAVRVTHNTVSGWADRNRHLFPKRGLPIQTIFSDATYDGDPVAKAQEMWTAGATTEEINNVIGGKRSAMTDCIRRHPELFPPRIGGKSAPDPVIATLPPLPSVSAPDVRPYVPGVRLEPVAPAVMELMALPIQTKPRKPKQCNWPMWSNAQRPTHVYCDGVATTGRVYCDHHHRVAHARS